MTDVSRAVLTSVPFRDAGERNARAAAGWSVLDHRVGRVHDRGHARDDQRHPADRAQADGLAQEHGAEQQANIGMTYGTVDPATLPALGDEAKVQHERESRADDAERHERGGVTGAQMQETAAPSRGHGHR